MRVWGYQPKSHEAKCIFLRESIERKLEHAERQELEEATYAPRQELSDDNNTVDGRNKMR